MMRQTDMTFGGGDDRGRRHANDAARGDGGLSVEIAAASDLGDAWQGLISRAPANVFMAPAAIRAAEESGFAAPRVLAAWRDGAGGRALAGLWALGITRPLPFAGRVLTLPPYDYAFVSSPVIERGSVDAVTTAFLATIAGDPKLPNVVRMQYLDGDDESYGAILRALSERGARFEVIAQRPRAYATRETGVKKSGSTRKKLRQDWNRMVGEGSLTYSNPRDAADVVAGFETFLSLEMASWKGANRTAFLSSAADAAFARRLISNLAADGNASVAMLTLDGTPIATQVLLYAGSTAYTWKTAYDATYARFSPGAVLVDKVAEELFAGPVIEAIESCSPDGGFMEQLWSGRRETVDLLVDLSPRGSLTFHAIRGWLRTRAKLKSLRDRLRSARKPAKAPKKPA